MACLDNLARPCLKIQKLGGVCGYSSRPWAPMPKTYLFKWIPWSQMAQIQILASALVSSVISGVSPNLLVPQFLTYKMK